METKKEESTQHDFRRLYRLVKRVPEYKEVRDGSGRKTNNADLIIQGWIWQTTHEEKYEKHKLTKAEYNCICNDIARKYNIKEVPNRCKSVITPEDCLMDIARKQLLAVVHENIRLRGYDTCPAYLNGRTEYAIGIILRAAGNKYKKFNDLPKSILKNIYSYFVNENKLFRK